MIDLGTDALMEQEHKQLLATLDAAAFAKDEVLPVR